MSDEIIINVSGDGDQIGINVVDDPISSVNGKTGIVILDKNDIGLSAVDNTSDLNKPLSNAAVSAFNTLNTSVDFLSSVVVGSGTIQSLSFNDVTSELTISSSNTVAISGYVTSQINKLGLSNVNSLSGNWNSVYNNVNLLSSNWFSASAESIQYAHANFLPLTGGLVSGPVRFNNNVTIFGDLSCSGTQTFANTIFSTTSSLSVVHFGSGPALYVGNNGDGDIASFYDLDQGVEILHVGGNNGSHPNVGVKTSTPNATLTVNGEISAASKIWATRLDLRDDTISSATRLDLIRDFDNASGSEIAFLKRRNLGNMPLSANDSLGVISFAGPFFAGASIEAKVDDLSQNNISSPTSLSFSTGTSAINSNTTRMTIRSSGNVGIDTTNPNERLTVSGNISSSNVIHDRAGNSNNWNSVYNNVNALSSSWEESADIIPTVTNYLSTNNVLLSSIDVTDRVVLDGQLYYVANEDGQWLGRTKLTQNTINLTTISTNFRPNPNTIIAGISSNIAMTSDGRSQVIVSSFNNTTYFSDDNGKTFSSNAAYPSGGVDVAMSSDGKYRTIVRFNQQISVSNDYGVSFIDRDIARAWSSIAMSSDGRFQTATVSNGNIFVSSNFGLTWNAKNIANNRKYASVCMSSSGKLQVATEAYTITPLIWISRNYGQDWVQVTQANGLRSAMSSDGRYITIASGSNSVWRSNNFGNSFTEIILPFGAGIICVAMSSDGKYQTAGASAIGHCYSRDHGNNWLIEGSNVGFAIAMSSDGKYQTAINNNNNNIVLRSISTEEVDGNLNVTGSINGANIIEPYARFTINGNVNLGNLSNSTEHIIPWNTEEEPFSDIIETQLTNDNVIIRRNGTYLVKVRFSCFDMFDASDYLRLRLRQSTTPIGGAAAGSLVTTLAWRFAGGILGSAGEMYVEGETVLRLTPESTGFVYLAATVLGAGGSGSGGTTFYPFFDNSQGTLPYMEIRKIA
jgi:hypothetical protein